MGRSSTSLSEESGDGARPVRVLRIIDRLNVGGPARQVVCLTAALQDSRFQSTLVTGNVAEGEGDMSYLAGDADVTPIVFPGLSREISVRDLLITFRLFQLIRRVRPDIVHTHKAKAGAIGRLAVWLYKWTGAGRDRPCRVVHTYHGHVFHSYYGPLRTSVFLGIERTLARFCTDRIVTVSPSQRDEISQTYRIGRREQFRVVPLGVEEGPAVAGPGDLRNQLGVPPGELLIGIVGRLSEVKNHGMFLEAAAALVASGVRARFVVVGDGHLRPALEARASALGIADRVTFAGFLREMGSVYTGLDIVALTSLNEGTPLTLLEGMAAGRPVAATEVGGVADIMGAPDGTEPGFRIWSHGVTSSPRDASAFTRALMYLIDNPEVRNAMGVRAHRFVREEHSTHRLVSRIRALYEEVLASEPSALPPAPGLHK